MFLYRLTDDAEESWLNPGFLRWEMRVLSGAMGTETYRDVSSLKDGTVPFCHQCVLGEVPMLSLCAGGEQQRTK